MALVPREALAGKTREVIEHHQDWDSPHAFLSVHWDGQELSTPTYACVMTDIDPPDYPRMMIKIAAEEYWRDPETPAHAYILQVEEFGVLFNEKTATAEEKAQFEYDRRNRRYHTRADAVEAASAFCADVHGRLWWARKIRGKEDAIEEYFYPPGKAPEGTLVTGLLAVAALSGSISFGLPPAGLAERDSDAARMWRQQAEAFRKRS